MTIIGFLLVLFVSGLFCGSGSSQGDVATGVIIGMALSDDDRHP